MIVTSESLKQEIDQLSEDQLQQVAEFIAFLKFRDKRNRIILDPALLAPLANDFAEEDISLVEMGMDDYKDMLIQKDNR